ncbi:MAG: transcriptional repressor [Selenomonas sp.]|uniref:Fur family transcriptional regulator n=1 Tax=Selenomonas sp. TaxID=2053611 RepID=UPI0025D807C6|nr:transcriptional repressor [Selenomonas sp.]MCI6085188.1 transcriptional repressor [Selenomonas sp.]
MKKEGTIMPSQTEVTDILRGKGYKATPQRLAIYDALAATREHPNADMLYQRLVPHYPTMSLATVYKTLGILCTVGLAQELNVGEDAFRYDANTDSHPHVRCMSCGRVEDVPVLNDAMLMRQAAASTGYDIEDRQIYLYGTCPSCREKKRKRMA